MAEVVAATEYRLKRIGWRGGEVPIVLQDVNGPCPLVALVNVLLLRGALELHVDRASVTATELLTLLSEHLLARSSALHDAETLNANVVQNLDDAMSLFPQLLRGLDVNVKFRTIRDIEFTKELVLFDTLGVALVHGWLVDPQDSAFRWIQNMSYNQIVEKIVNHDAKSDPLKQSAPARLERSSDIFASQSSEKEQIQALKRFLAETASQLTYHGLVELHATLEPDELAIFFRNNHFSVITKHDGRLYLLVSDQGYLHQPNVVWERLDEVEGDAVFVDQDWIPFQAISVEVPQLGAPFGLDHSDAALAKQIQEQEDLELARRLCQADEQQVGESIAKREKEASQPDQLTQSIPIADRKQKKKALTQSASSRKPAKDDDGCCVC